MTFDGTDKIKINRNSTFDFGDGSYTQPSNSKRFNRHHMSDMQHRHTPNWLIRDLAFEQQIILCFAPPQSFKSFLVHALASMLAHGMEWQGRLLKPRRVIYVAGEGFPMFYFRRLAWFKHHGLPPEDDGLEVVDCAVDLTNPADVATFIVEMQRDCDGLGLIIFDTLSTCSAGHNESDSAVMTLVIEHAKLIARSLNSAVMFVHHPGKDASKGSRGHSSLLGNIDAEWIIERHGMTCTLTVTKQKDGENGLKFYFQAHRIPLGLYDEDGVERSSLALEPCAKPAPAGAGIDPKIADRMSIAATMKPGERATLSGLAHTLAKVLGKRAGAIERVKAAIPTDWTRVRRGEGFAEVRRVEPISAGKPSYVEMREVADEP
jgi:hypothetical protein